MKEEPQLLTRPKIPVDPAWTPQEQWVWERIQAGEIADFNTMEGYKDPKDWPDTGASLIRRILRPTFLKTVLQSELYRTAIPHHGLRIVGAWCQDSLDLSHATLTCQLWLEHSRFESKVALSALRTPHVFSLKASVFSAPVDMTSMHVESDLFLRGATFAKVNLRDAQIEGRLDLTQATVSGMLNMNRLYVGQALFMRTGARFAEVNLRGAQIEGQLDLTQATVSGMLTMERLHVGQALFMCQGVFAKDNPGASITASATGGDSASWCNPRTPLAARAEMRVPPSEGTGVADAMIQANPGMTINLSFAKIDAMLDLSGADLPSLNLTSTRIGGDLRFANQVNARWQPEAQLHLYNTEVMGMQDAPEASPDIVWLEGFTYSRLAQLAAANTLSWSAQEDFDLRVSLTNWLSRQKQYTPQPYEQLASVSQKTGYKSLATRILFESKKREASQTRYGWSWLVLWLQRILIGYGYYNFQVLWAVIVFLIMGVAVLHFTGERDRLHMSTGVSYSIDMLLPIIKLNKKHDEFIQHLNPGVRWYFYFHQIIGYILASFLVAGLAGLTKKNP